MRSKVRVWVAAWCLAGAMAFAGCAGQPGQPGRPGQPAVHQVSTLQALMQGAYEGQVACRELPKHGTLGIGTFDALDGELILLEGKVYQARADGRVVADPRTSTPFADVVRFEPETVARDVAGPLNLAQTLEMLEEKAGSKNLLYAVRIDGDFREMKVRSVPRQARPYPPLAQAVKQQRVFELKDVRGTLVGFRFPQYTQGLNMPGWHLHFISADRRAGGHVLEFSGEDLDVRLQTIRRFEMTLPTSGGFVTADLGRDMSKEIHEVEK